MKFDIIIGNPPYGNLHLPILKKCVLHLTSDGIYSAIQPSRWLQDPMWKLKRSSDAKKMQPILEGKIHNVELIKSTKASEIFKVAFIMDLGIFTIKNDGGNFPYDKLSKMAWGIDLSPFSKVIKINNFKLDLYDESMQHFVPVATIAPASSRKGFLGANSCHKQYGYFVDGKSNNCKYGNGLTLAEAQKANKRRTCGKTVGSTVKQFNTAEEAKNFYDYIRLDAFRFFIYITTCATNIQSKFLPYPEEHDAFTIQWTDELFYTYFDIAPPEQEIIKNTMKDFPLK